MATSMQLSVHCKYVPRWQLHLTWACLQANLTDFKFSEGLSESVPGEGHVTIPFLLKAASEQLFGNSVSVWCQCGVLRAEGLYLR